MDVLEVLAHPFDEVILKDTLNHLVQQIGGDQLEYITPGEIRRIWLMGLSNNMLT